MNRGIFFFAAAIGLMLGLSPAFADSATWLTNPTDGDWNQANNWMPVTVPNGPTDVATFGTSNQTSVSISNPDDEEISGITFDSGASAFTITTFTDNFYFLLTISGAGIVNNSGITQHFIADRSLGQAQLRFRNSSTAGSSTIFTNNSTSMPVIDLFVATIAFLDASTAGNATFVNNPGLVEGAVSGYISFEGNSTAGYGTFTNNGGGNAVQGASTRFSGNASADHGSFLNKGASGSPPPNFLYSSSGFMWFNDNSSAGNATITSNGGSADLVPGGQVVFYDSSRAGAATFTNNPGEASGASGGGTLFVNGASADKAAFTNNGSMVSGAYGGYARFFGNSNAGNGRFLNKRGSAIDARGGATRFYNTASANHGDFTTEGASLANQLAGNVEFNDNSTATDGTFTNNGGTVVDAIGGSTDFRENSTAANATLVANGGLNGAEGGQVQFEADSTGGTAQVVLLGNGFLGISAHNPPGVTIGSLEGSGSVFLGSNTLTVGTRSNSTSFSGVIQDGGSLTKTGTGTLTLSGANTYTGSTTINAGKLSVDGSIMSTVTVNNGGTVGGSGTTGSITVNSGGIVAPGDAQTLHITGNYAQNAGGVLKIAVAGAEPSASGHLDISGSTAIDGTLEVRFVNGFLPVSGQVFKLLNVAGAFAGSFSQIIFPDLRAGFQFLAEFVEGSYQITALNDGVAATGFLNISTRMQVGTGDGALIGGFIVTGSESKRVILRAIGPSLMAGGTPLPGRLADPTLELRDNVGGLILSNDNWVESTQAQEIIDSGIPPSDDHEAAIVATLAPGGYTAVMRGTNNTTGIGVAEVYDLAQDVSASLANISSRGFVETADGVMIGGFIAGNQATPVIVRAIGPSLTQSGIANALADPTLELHNGDGGIIAFNDDWQDSNQVAIETTGIPPTNDKESAIVVTLAPGNYTAIVRGQNDTTGVGLVEVYDLH